VARGDPSGVGIRAGGAREAWLRSDIRLKHFRGAIAVALVLALALTSAAAAHDQPYSWLDLRLAEAGLDGRLTAHIVDLAHEAGIAVPESLLDVGFAARHADALQAMLAARLILVADRDTLRPSWTGCVPVPERNAVTFTWRTSWKRMPGVVRVGGPSFRLRSAA
jgi:hypothetical protein